MGRAKPIASCDCETDPFLFGRRPEPFIWGFYDGKTYVTFDTTKEFVDFVKNKEIILYAHNGGKFDFIFLMPHLGETKAQIINGRIISMFLGKCELRDSFAIIPVALKELGGKKEIDYKKLEVKVRHKHTAEIKEYLFFDCKSLYDACKMYRETAGKYKTIASNALAFSRKLNIDVGKTNHRFDANYRPFYYGGRTECFQPGTHSNLILLDIHSAYPFAMMHHHATGESTDFVRRSGFNGMTREEIQRSFIVVECMAQGCFPIRTTGAQGLIFPHEYNEYKITGWEYIAAKDLGLISNEKIIEVRSSSKSITFKPYVDHWYKYKLENSQKDADGNRLHLMEYIIGKIMQNSLYGKLAQNPARYYDYKIVKAGTRLPCRNPQTAHYNPDDCIVCGYKLDNHGWTLEHEYGNHEIHRRESLWKYKFAYGDEWQGKKIYKNVATGASITGFTRAHLLRAMASLGMSNVIYCDTDGIVCKEGADLSGIPITDDVGDWEIEDRGCKVGHFAGKKLYGIVKSNGKHKLASKGAKLTFQDIAAIAKGETIQWRNDAPTFKLDGSAAFVVRNIRSTAKLKTPIGA